MCWYGTVFFISSSKYSKSMWIFLLALSTCYIRFYASKKAMTWLYGKNQIKSANLDRSRCFLWIKKRTSHVFLINTYGIIYIRKFEFSRLWFLVRHSHVSFAFHHMQDDQSRIIITSCSAFVQNFDQYWFSIHSTLWYEKRVCS